MFNKVGINVFIFESLGSRAGDRSFGLREATDSRKYIKNRAAGDKRYAWGKYNRISREKCRKGKKWYVFADEIGKSLTFYDIAGKTVWFALFSLIKCYNA